MVANFNTVRALAIDRDLIVKVDEGWYDVYVGRNPRYGDPKYGNPFKIGSLSRDEVCNLHLKSLVDKLASDRDQLIEFITPLAGKILGCHCAPQRCHAENYLRMLKFLRIGED